MELLSLNEYLDIQEAALSLGNKMYPRANNLLVMAGSAASGKGTIVKSLIGFEGKIFDVDELKSKMIKLKSPRLQKLINQKLGIELDELNFKNPKHVQELHAAIEELGIIEKEKEVFILANKNSKNKPNVIFDVTLKNIKKFNEVMDIADEMNYPKENRHIVWVLNKIEIALEQNKLRDRTVPEDILIQTHIGSSITIKELIDNTDEYRKRADGDIFILFNAKDIDVIFDKNSVPNKTPIVLKGYNAIKIKSAGKPADKSKLNAQITDKINQYVFDTVKW